MGSERLLGLTAKLVAVFDEELRRSHPEIILSGGEVWDIYARHTPFDKKIPTYDIKGALKLILENPAAKEELETRNEARKAQQR